MLWVWKVAIYVGATILGRLLRPRPPEPDKRQAEPFRLPTIDPSRPIRVIAGLVHINDPAVLWYGRVFKTTLAGENNNDFDVWTVAVHLGLCLGPVDAAPELFWDGKLVTDYTANPGGVGTNSWGILTQRWDKLMPSELHANHFLLDSYRSLMRDGYTFYAGSQDQLADAFLTYEGFTAAPAYHGLCHLILWRTFLGPSSVGAPSMQRISVGLARRPNTLGITAGHEIVGVGCNAVCFIYEVLTDATWACGMPSTVIDVPGFRAAAETNYNEGFGISIDLAEQREAGDVIDDICSTINAVVFPDPETAMVKIKLIRNDYVAASLPLFDDSNAKGIELSRLGWHETKNIVRVRYAGEPGVAVVNGSTRVAVETNLANAQIVGGLNAQEVDYPLIQDPAVAQAVAARDLRALSYPLARVELDPDRTAYTLRPGDAFRVSSVLKNIPETICRVGRLGLGRLEDGRMHIGAVEDVFSAGWTGVDPGGSPAAMLAFVKKTTGSPQLFARRVTTGGGDAWSPAEVAAANPTTNQTLPTAVSDGVDGMIAVWQNGSSNFDIYAQRFDPLGNPLWGTGGVVICSAAGPQTLPQVVADGVGGAIFVWPDSRDTGTTSNLLYAQRIDANGSTLWATNGIALLDDSAFDCSEVSIISDGASGAFVAFKAWSSSNRGVRLQRITATGALPYGAGGIIVATTVPNNGVHEPALTLGAGDDVFFAYRYLDGTIRQDCRSRATGARKSGWPSIGLTIGLSGGALEPRSCSDDAGGVITVWSDQPGSSNRFLAQRISPAGAALWTANGVVIHLTTSGVAPGHRAIVKDGLGGAIIVLLIELAGTYLHDAFAQRLTAVGGLAYPAQKLLMANITAALSHGVAVLADTYSPGGAFAFWYAAPSGTTPINLYGQRVSSTGADMWTAGGRLFGTSVQTGASLGADCAVAVAIPVDAVVATSSEGAAQLLCAATVTAAGSVTSGPAAVLTCTATVIARADGTHSAAAVINAAVTLAPKGTVAWSARAAIAAAATVAAAGTVTQVPIATITASANVVAVGTV